jgi:hypothetical protein
MASEFNIKNGFISNNDSIVQGSLTATTLYTTTSSVYGNLLLGTTTDNGVSKLQIKGTTASDGPTLGTELATTATGTNWVGTSFALGYDHTTGSTVALTSTLAAVNGTYYQIAYTITGRTTGSISINYGGSNNTSITSTGTLGPLATTTGVLTITPTTDFDGTLVLSVKAQTTTSVATTTFTNSSGTIVNEIRNSSSNTNLFIGQDSGRRVTTGLGNIFLGNGSGKNNTTGTQNTFIGFNSGQVNSLGLFNTFIGYQTGLFNTTGGYNTFIGQNAGYTNTTGNSNIFLGQSAGYQNIGGGSNVFLGLQAGYNNTSGGSNINIGLNAGFANQTGSENVFMGYTAGRFISNGITTATVVNKSILIGANTKPLADTQTNQIVIGDSTVGLGSNTTVLGNSSTVTTAIYGNLLLGTTSDGGGKLQISGSINPTSTVARGVSISPTLVATANNDTLIGLDISPTFTLGAFTGTTSVALRVHGNIIPLNPSFASVGTGSLPFNNGVFNAIVYAGTFQGYSNGYYFAMGGTNIGRVHTTTGNFTLQNGGTFTDIPSARLQVNSTTQGFLPPRMTNAQRLLISSPSVGLMVYCTDTTEGVYVNKSTGWTFIG